MAGSVNKVILIGSLGRDPEIRVNQNENKIAICSLATTESWKDKATGEKRSNTQWHRVIVWNSSLAGIVESYAKKGSKVYVEGQINTRQYTKDGIEKTITEIIIPNFTGQFILLGSKSDSSKPQDNINNTSNNDIVDDLDDEVPF